MQMKVYITFTKKNGSYARGISITLIQHSLSAEPQGTVLLCLLGLGLMLTCFHTFWQTFVSWNGGENSLKYLN
jgi:hypothetical protein